MTTRRPDELRAVIAGCARDCARALPAALANVERVASVFQECAFVFVENDSRDATKRVLGAWRDRHAGCTVINLDGLAASRPARTLRLEIARNEYLKEVRDRYSHFDVVVVMDMDETNAMPLDVAAVAEAVRFLYSAHDHDAVFANQTGTYYDMWALRHPERCPGDLWEAVLDDALKHGCTDGEAFGRAFAPRVFELAVDAPPLEVTSAFGGLGLYKLPRLLAVPTTYVGSKPKVLHLNGAARQARLQVCEHVSLNEGLVASGGRLHVLPWLINARVGRVDFPPSAYRSLLF